MARVLHRKHVDRCLECGAETPRAYCAECGQEAVDSALSFRDHVEDFAAEVFSVESRLPQTLKTLILRPGFLTRAYNAGQRVRYAAPLRLYFFVSIVFFLAMSLLGSPANARVSLHIGPNTFYFGTPSTTADAPPPPASSSPASSSPASSSPAPPDSASDDGHDFRDVREFDAWMAVPKNAKEVPSILRTHLRSLVQNPGGYLTTIVELASRIAILLVPIHALLLRALYLRPRRLYGELVVFSLHLHAFAFVAVTTVMLAAVLFPAAAGPLALLLTGVLLLYATLAARVAYGQGFALSLLKMSVVGAFYLVILVGAVAVTAVAAIFDS